VPFTPAHAAAALPFRNARLVLSALVVGTFAPDFEFFLRLEPRGGFSHTFAGVFLFTLPAALVMLWVLHRWAKFGAVALMPQPLRFRLTTYLSSFRFGGLRRFALIVLSVLVGIATHVAWDSFTHSRSWIVQHSQFLNQVVHLPHVHPTQVCRIVQHTSTVVGLAILCVWFAGWYRRTPPVAPPAEAISPRKRTMLWIVLLVLAAVCGGVRFLAGAAFAGSWSHLKWYLGDAILTWIAAIWWQLAAMGYFLKPSRD
jgi:hypothetical protein